MIDRLEVLKDLTMEAAREVTQEAPGRFQHLERLLAKLDEELRCRIEMQAMSMTAMRSLADAQLGAYDKAPTWPY